MKVLYFTNIPVPYRMNFFNELGKLCDLTVMMESEYAGNLNADWLKRFSPDNYKYILLPKIGRTSKTRINYGYSKIIMTQNFDIIVVGSYYSLSAMLFICFLRRHKIQYILNSDGGFIKQDRRLVYLLKKYFISGAAGYITTGKKTSEYLRYYGAAGKFLHISFSSLMKKDVDNLSKKHVDKEYYRSKLNINAERMVLYVGQFIYRKGVDILLKAANKINTDCTIYIVGGLPTEEYERIIQENSLTNIEFVEFLDKKTLEEYYQAADVFVLPTREDIWGLVVNEALGMGVPVITTDMCIAGLELINGINGKIVPVGDELKLAQAINEIISKPEMFETRSQEAKKSVEKYTIENMAMQHYKFFNAMEGKL